MEVQVEWFLLEVIKVTEVFFIMKPWSQIEKWSQVLKLKYFMKILSHKIINIIQ